MFRSARLLLAAAFLCTAVDSYAQETSAVALTMAYPASVGVLWKVTDRVGVRPHLELEIGEIESPPRRGASAPRVTEFWQFGAGVSALFVVHQDAALSLYVSPRYSHHRALNIKENVVGVLCIGSFTTLVCPDDRVRGHALAESLGVQYLANRRLGIFGEVGVAHEWKKTPPSTSGNVSSSGSSSRRTGIRSGVGLLVFF